MAEALAILPAPKLPGPLEGLLCLAPFSAAFERRRD